MQAKNKEARLITVNHKGKAYKLLPAGKAVEVPASFKDVKFVKSL